MFESFPSQFVTVKSAMKFLAYGDVITWPIAQELKGDDGVPALMH